MNESNATVRPTVSPFRAYKGGMNAEGRFLIILGYPPGPVLNDLMADGAAFTEADVIEWSSKLPFRPGDDDFRELVYALNLMRVTEHVEDAPSFHFGVYEEVLKRVERSITDLTRDLPKLIEFYRGLDSTRAAASAEVFKNLLSTTTEYLKERWIAWGGRTPSRRHEPWHDDAIYLAFVLRRAADRAGKDLSFTYQQAPAVVFIDEVLTRAGVKHGSPEAIARALHRYEDRIARQLKSMLEKPNAISTT